MKYTQTRGALDDDPNLILKLMGEQDNYQMFQDDLKQLDATAKTQFRTTFNAFGEEMIFDGMQIYPIIIR